MIKIRWLAIVLMIPLGTSRAHASDVDEFLKSYRESRARLLNRYDQFRGSGVETETVTKVGGSSPDRRFVRDYEYLRTGEDERLTITTREAIVDGLDRREISLSGAVIRRGDRLFSVKGPMTGGEYSLVFMGRSDDPGIRSLNRDRDRYFRPTTDAPGFNLPIFLDKPELSIQSVKNLNRDGESLVQVDYTITFKLPKPSVQRAWCLLRPDLDWSLREFNTTYEGGSPFSYSGVVIYEPGSTPKPKSIQQKLTLATSIQVDDFAYTKFDFEETPAKEFSLASYGLGEAESPPARSRNLLPYWFGGIAAIALILSVWLRVVARRRGRASDGA